MKRRVDGARAATVGESPESIKDLLSNDLIQHLGDEQKERINAAIGDVLRVYPDRVGVYKVISEMHEEPSEYKVDLTHPDHRTCTCGDFLFRCNSHKGQICKHIWRVNLLMQLDALPRPTLDPYDWLLDELTRDYHLVQDMDLSVDGEPLHIAATIRELIAEMKETHRFFINFEEMCNQRTILLTEAYTIA